MNTQANSSSQKLYTKHESHLVSLWTSSFPPEKILAIRLQALGDTVITFPYLSLLNELLPFARIDFLTREEFEDLPRSLSIFHRVYAIGGGRNSGRQSVSALTILPQLLREEYDFAHSESAPGQPRQVDPRENNILPGC